jgi:MFS family permease
VVSNASATKRAVRFVVLIGIVSLFADFTYEGARSITGPFLAILGASGTVVGIVAGLGEFLGYGLRLFSGRVSEKTGKFWPITLFGYFLQMTCVPLLALAGSWPVAAMLIVGERIGKAIRNPPRDVMLSHAAKQMGYGWGFGLHEALDQFGALVGPLVAAYVLSVRGRYDLAFAVLLIPATITLALIVVARLAYPRPEDLESHSPEIQTSGLGNVYWIYFAGACLVAAGFADFSLAAFRFQQSGVASPVWIPIFYAIAMGVSGLGSLVFGHLFDRFGIKVLVPLTLISAAATPLLFLGDFRFALLGVGIWGVGMGVHESIIPAAVATMVPKQRRPSAYGTFTAGFGISWFVGSAVIGSLYDVSIPALIAFSVVAEFASLPLFILVKNRTRGLTF